MTATAALVLPTVDPAVARARSAVLAALGGIGGIGIAGDADGWVTCAGDIAVAPLLVDGRRAAILADDGHPDAVAAVAALAILESLLARIETALGLQLRPEGLATAPAPGAMIFDVADTGARLLLALPPGIAVRPAPPDGSDGHRLAARWQVHLPGPLLAAAPAPGDLLIGVAAAGVLLLAGQALPIRLDRRDITVTGQWRHFMDDDAATGFDFAAARLPVTIAIDGAIAPLADLAQLAPGAVLPLPGDSQRLAVTVMAGGAPLATGTLVAVGDGHGVLIDTVFGRQTR